MIENKMEQVAALFGKKLGEEFVVKSTVRNFYHVTVAFTSNGLFLRGAKAVDKTCRNHGGCPHCESGRLHKYLRQMPAQDKEAIQDLMAFKARYKNGK